MQDRAKEELEDACKNKDNKLMIDLELEKDLQINKRN